MLNNFFSKPLKDIIYQDKQVQGGTAYVGDDGKHTVIINSGYLNGKTKGEILGVVSEEASHVINGAEGRQISTGTDEKGLESTGRATNEYFKGKYKDDDTTISLTSEGAIDTSKLGTNVGDKIYLTLDKGDDKNIFEELIQNNKYDINKFSQMSDNIKNEILSSLQLITEDKLAIGKDEYGNEIIIISQKYNKNYTNKDKKESTEKLRNIIESKDKNIWFRPYNYNEKTESPAASVNNDSKTYTTDKGVGTNNVLIRIPDKLDKIPLVFFEDTTTVYGNDVSFGRLIPHEMDHTFDLIDGRMSAMLNISTLKVEPNKVPKTETRYIYDKNKDTYYKLIPTDRALITERSAVNFENKFFTPRIIYEYGEYDVKFISKEEYNKIQKSKQEIIDTSRFEWEGDK